MLSDDLGALYKFYHLMKYYGKYSLFEVDNMYPFEREIFFNLLADTKQKESSR